jgi:hypothetical protein
MTHTSPPSSNVSPSTPADIGRAADNCDVARALSAGRAARTLPGTVDGMHDDACHLHPHEDHATFEQLLVDAFGTQYLRTSVHNTTPAISNDGRGGAQTPAAWAAAAGRRVADGVVPADVITQLGPLAVFCTALGSLTLLSALRSGARRHVLDSYTPIDADIDAVVTSVLTAGPAALDLARATLNALDDIELRLWTVHLLDVLIAGYRSLQTDGADDARIAQVLDRFSRRAA